MTRRVCSVCGQPYDVPAATIRGAKRTGEPWYCPEYHPQFPNVPAANPKIRRLLDHVLATRGDEGRGREALQARLKRKEERIQRLMRVQRALSARVKSLTEKEAKNRSSPSKRLRECEKRSSDAEARADALEQTLAAAKEQGVADQKNAIQSALQAQASLVFDELELSRCPALECTYKFATLDDLLVHAQAAHLHAKSSARQTAHVGRVKSSPRRTTSERIEKVGA